MAPSKCQRVKSTEEWITSYKLKLQRLSAVLPSQTEKETISGLLTKLLVESRKQSVARFSELLEPSRPASQMANQNGIITVGISVEYKETKLRQRGWMKYLVMNSTKTPRQVLSPSSSPAASDGGGGGGASSIAEPPPSVRPTHGSDEPAL
jgi:hypothetical protein